MKKKTKEMNEDAPIDAKSTDIAHLKERKENLTNTKHMK